MNDNYGMAQRRQGPAAPPTFDKATKKVCLDVQPCAYSQPTTDGETEEVQGYSWVELYLGDAPLDYGSVKSALIEHAYSPKDEFALLMNAMAVLASALGIEHEDMDKFVKMNSWRGICAQAAKEVCASAGTLIAETPTQEAEAEPEAEPEAEEGTE